MTVRHLAALAAMLLVACDSGASEPDALGTLAVDCGGKCDGFDDIRDAWGDPSEVRVDELLAYGADFVSDELNEVIASGDLGGLAVDFHDQTRLKPLVDDLAAAFGERELTTAVNAVRSRHLEQTSDTVYAETSFTLREGFGQSWGRSVGGLLADEDANVRVGFRASGEIVARVVSAHDAESENPLTRLLSLRDFAVPRSLDDLRDMKPGELVALRGKGDLGANLGVGVPLFVADPTAYATYSIVLSAGLRTRLGGTLDVQLLRMDGDEVVLDVGIVDVKEKSAYLAVNDRWGVQSLITNSVEIAGHEVDLGDLVDNALQRQLNDRLSLIEAVAESSESESRTTVARLRFDLAKADDALLGPAIAQALYGDVRLAQALSHRGEPGIVAELDLMRSGASSASFAGIEIFGMSAFSRRMEENGTIVVQSPAGVRTVMFDSLEEEWKGIFSRHGYNRVGISGLQFDPRDPNSIPRGEANLVVQLLEGDVSMEQDKLLDHIDGVLLAFAGEPALKAIEEHGNAMHRWVRQECRGAQVYDDCPIDIHSDPLVVGEDGWIAKGLAALDAQTGHLPQETRDFLHALGDVRLRAQSAYHTNLNGPGGNWVLDYRLDDAALQTLALQRSGADLEAAVKAYLQAANIDRTDDVDEIAEDRDDIASRVDGLEETARMYDEYARKYRLLTENEGASVETIGMIGARGLEIRYPVDASNRPIYAEAQARSLPEARADIMRGLYDDLSEAADDWGPHAEQTVAYVLLSMLPVEQTELEVSLKLDLEDTAWQWREPYLESGLPTEYQAFIQGTGVTPIDGGLFDIDGIPLITRD